MENAYKITLPNTQAIVYAPCRGDAIRKFVEQSGVPIEFFKRHGTCKICTYRELSKNHTIADQKVKEA